MYRNLHNPGWVYLIDLGPVCKLGVSTNHNTFRYRMTEYRMNCRRIAGLSEPYIVHMFHVSDMRNVEIAIQQRWKAYHSTTILVGTEHYQLPESTIMWFRSLRSEHDI